MNISEKYVQGKLDTRTYLKIREYATLHSISLSKAIEHAVIFFIKEKNNEKTE